MAFNVDELIKKLDKVEAPSDAEKKKALHPLGVILDPSLSPEELADSEYAEEDEDDRDYPYEADEDEDEDADADVEDEADSEPEEEEEEEDDFYLRIEQPPVEVEPFRQREIDNLAYADAVTAYYEEKNYEVAIGKFQDAIDNERKYGTGAPNEIIAKSMYWQAESYVKTENRQQATAVLESLINCFEGRKGGHYLVVAAQRRLETLKARGASHAKNF